MLEYQIEKSTLTLKLSGNLKDEDNENQRAAIYADAQKQKLTKICIEAEALKTWDSTLVALIYKLIKQTQGKTEIEYIRVPKHLAALINLALSVDRKPTQETPQKLPFIESVGQSTYEKWQSFKKGLNFMKENWLSFMRCIKGTAIMRKVDFLFVLEDCSYKAFGIVSLISFMVGLILAFVGAVQMQMFGVEIYVSSLVAISMTRIMGAIMAGIVMSGRTGASYAATLGTMQVNEEIDALKTMGVPVTYFLVLPRIIALMMTMPLLVMLSDFMGMLGGAMVGMFVLGFSPAEYWEYTYKALSMKNFLIGMFHGFVYGYIIAMCGCYYGIFCGRNANSVGLATTSAVVSSIVWMIVITGVLTVIFVEFGL